MIHQRTGRLPADQLSKEHIGICREYITRSRAAQRIGRSCKDQRRGAGQSAYLPPVSTPVHPTRWHGAESRHALVDAKMYGGQHISGVRMHRPGERGVRGTFPQPNGKGSLIKTAAQTAAEQKLIAVLVKNLCPRGEVLHSSR